MKLPKGIDTARFIRCLHLQGLLYHTLFNHLGKLVVREVANDRSWPDFEIHLLWFDNYAQLCHQRSLLTKMITLNVFASFWDHSKSKKNPVLKIVFSFMNVLQDEIKRSNNYFTNLHNHFSLIFQNLEMTKDIEIKTFQSHWQSHLQKKGWTLESLEVTYSKFITIFLSSKCW